MKGAEAARGFAAASAFRFPAYRRLWIGAFVSSVGTWTQDVALAWLIHTRLREAHYLGLRQFAAEAPLLAFMLVGGTLADRVDRRRILLTSNWAQMAFAAALAVLFALDRLGIAAILGIAFLTGLAQSQSAPTYQAVLTSLVPPAEIPSAVALNSLQFNLSRLIGPAIAGLLLAHAGTGVCFGVNALSFLAVIAALWALPIPSPSRASGETLLQSLRAGLRHVGAHPVLSRLMLLGAAGSFLTFPLITFLPVVAGDVLHTGSSGYSLLLSSFGGGAIVGALFTAWRGRAPHRSRGLLIACLVYGAATLLALFSGRQAPAMAWLFVSGLSLVAVFATLNSLVQEHAPDDLRGRVLSIYGLGFRGGMPLGSLTAGFFVDAFGAPAVIGVFCAVLILLATTVYARSATLRAL